MLKRFMLPIHKQKRIQRITRLSVDHCEHEADSHHGNGDSVAGERRRERAIRGLLATLDHDTLKVLHEVVESRGASQGSCVLLPKRTECEEVLRPAAPSAQAAVAMVCRYFRWTDLAEDGRLKRLPVCDARDDDPCVCINPYHWSRLQRQETALPVVCAKLQERLHPADPLDECDRLDLLEPESVTTGGTAQYGSISSLDGCSYSTWCRLVYFERRRRVGQVGGWSVRTPVQHVFYSLPHGDGLSLSAVSGQNPEPEPDVVRTRQHIGNGVTLSLEPDGVWLYNRSERPVFVMSPTLLADPTPSEAACAQPVHKLPPGFSLLIYEPRVAALCRKLDRSEPRLGLRSHASVTVSFAKGWGAKYSRRTVAECPCWMELWFCGAAIQGDT